MLSYLTRRDVSVLIVGDGSGRSVLEERIPDDRRSDVVLTGRVPHGQVTRALHAMDIGFITQTLDGLGSYRLTTKLPEYLAAGLPVAMSPIPGFYDYVGAAGWPLPPLHPASTAFHQQCAQWLDALPYGEVRQAACRAHPIAAQRFDYAIIAARFAAFVHDLLGIPSREAPLRMQTTHI
jgi:glycosyltransferase involved in cell wall biosynthesis